MNPSNAVAPAEVRIDEALSPRDRFDNWRQAVSAVFDMEVENRAAFDCGMTSWKLGELVLGRFWSSGNNFVRDRRKIAQSGLDHYVIQTLTAGRSVVVEGASPGEWPVGSVRILDMTRPIRTEADGFSNLTLIVPRTVLEPLLGAPDDLHGLTLGSDTVGAALLGRLLHDLSARAGVMTQGEAEALGPGVAAMAAACFGPSVAAVDQARAARMSLSRRAVQAHIDAHLGSAELSAESLCRHFGLSRASLYRLLDPVGGVEGYIRARRLDQAYRLLSSLAGRTQRVANVAHGLGFTNQASFSRAFRRRFDMSPSDARDRYAEGTPLVASASGATFLDWLKRSD